MRGLIPDLPDRTHGLVVSYIAIRRAIGISGLLLPVVLGPIGWLLFGIEFQDNISSYYHTPLRDIFVGTLCAMGIFLFCYRGHDWVEDWTANLGCASALGIALFPLDAESDPLYQQSLVGAIHCFSGGLFFMTLAFYSLYHFPTGNRLSDEPEPHAQQRNFVYRMSGGVIFLSTVCMSGYLLLPTGDWKEICDQYNVLFWLEWIAIWSFAAAWLTKGRTIFADIGIDLMALTQERLIGSKSDGSTTANQTKNEK